MTTRHHPSTRAERRANSQRHSRNSRHTLRQERAAAGRQHRRALLDDDATREAVALLQRLMRFGVSK